MKKKDLIKIGFMTFALFFGAGNLIFPPLIGYQSGQNFIPSVLGFVTTGVCLPLLGAIAGSMVYGRIELLGKKVGKWFYTIFPTIIYLAIGPIFIVPRSASVTYTIGIEPLLQKHSSVIMFFVTLIYFVISYYFVMNSHKMVDFIGKIITPLLFIVIGIMVIFVMVNPAGPIGTPTGDYVHTPYFKGFVEGFLTMDALGALVVANILVATFKDYGIEDKKDIVKYASIASIIAGIGLTFVYIALTYVGATSNVFTGITNGAVILTNVMGYMFGDFGIGILGIVIAFACLSTSIGVTSASSRYFHSKFPSLSYKKWVIIVSFVSFLIANIGLDKLIEITIPVLSIIYPAVIIVIILAFLYEKIKDTKILYSITVITALCISIINTLDSLNIKIPLITKLFEKLPLYNVTLGWIVPTLIIGTITFLIEFKKTKTL